MAKGLKVRLIGKVVRCKLLYTKLKNKDGTMVACRPYTMLGRALAAAAVGHDYDSRASASGSPRGLNGLGPPTILLALAEIRRSLKEKDPLKYVVSAVEQLCKTPRCKDSTNADAERIAQGAFGFMYHLVYNIETKKVVTFLPLPK